MLAHLPACTGHVVDLGCGNGALGLAMARRNKTSRVVFVDESHLALASARAGWEASGLTHDHVAFHATDGLTESLPGSVDLVLCNPPFHDGRAVGGHLARRLFVQAREALRPGGVLQVVGNRHLEYHRVLRTLFGGCELVASDAKFVVLRAARR